MWRRFQKLAAFLLLCCGLALVLGAVWFSEPFSGEMRLRLHGREGLVVRNAISGARDAPILAAPPETLPFYTPESADKLSGNRLYDAMPLPFLVRLEPANTGGSLYVTRSARLVVEEAGETKTIDAPPGAAFDVAGKTLSVRHAHDWVYLHEYHEGRPLALLNLCQVENGALQLDDAPPAVVAASELSWVLDGDGRAFRLAFFDDDAMAREALPTRLKWAEDARWGVEDGGRVQWFESLSAGSGIIALDGTDYTLMDYGYVPGEAPALTVSVTTEDGRALRRVEANVRNGGRVRFEAPACAPLAVLVHALPDGRAVLGAYRHAVRLDVATLDIGRWWVPEGGEHAVRFEGAARHAVVVDAEQSKRSALEFTWDGEARRIVEGETLELGEATLSYEANRTQPPTVPNCVLSFVDENDAVVEKAILETQGGSARFGGWEFAVATAPDAPGGDFILSATHVRPLAVQGALGAALAVLGGGWLLLPWLRRRG